MQYSVQFVMNANGFNEVDWANQESFTFYGAGYVVPNIERGYGFPVKYVVLQRVKEDGERYAHAICAVFIGDRGDDINDIIRFHIPAVSDEKT